MSATAWQEHLPFLEKLDGGNAGENAMETYMDWLGARAECHLGMGVIRTFLTGIPLNKLSEQLCQDIGGVMDRLAPELMRYQGCRLGKKDPYLCPFAARLDFQAYRDRRYRALSRAKYTARVEEMLRPLLTGLLLVDTAASAPWLKVDLKCHAWTYEEEHFEIQLGLPLLPVLKSYLLRVEQERRDLEQYLCPEEKWSIPGSGTAPE